MAHVPRRIVAAVALAALLGPTACSDDDARTPATDRPSKDAAGTTAPPVDLELSRSDADALDVAGPGGEVAAVLPPGPDGRWLIAGHHRDADTVGRPVVWRSDDGLSWSSHDVAPEVEGSFRVKGAVHHGDTTVVVGREVQGAGHRGAVWVGSDDRFERVGGSEFDGASTTVDRVVSGSEGLVAIGSAGADEMHHPVVWRSPDGRSWTADEQAGRTMGESRTATVHGIAVRDGTTVAGGTVAADATTDAAIWLSPDGVAWERVASDVLGGPGEQVVNDVVFDGSSWLASGHVERDGATVPAVWRSPDARTWELLDTRFEVLNPPVPTWGVTVRSVRGVGGYLVAVGGSSAAPHIWWSTDAVTWTAQVVPDDLGRSLDDGLGAVAIAGPDDAVAISGTGAGRPVVVRVRPGGSVTEVTAGSETFPPPRPTGSAHGLDEVDGRLVARGARSTYDRQVGESSDDAVLWQSTDGTAWEAVDAGTAFDRSRVTQVVSWNGATSAVGFEQLDRGPQRSGRPDPLAWIDDTDGWTRSPHGATFPGLPEGEGTVRMEAAVAVGDRLVAVGTVRSGEGSGSGGIDALAWTSVDGRVWSTVESPSFGGEGDQLAGDTCLVPGGVTVVGHEQFGSAERPVAWRSTDGSVWDRAELPPPVVGSTASMESCASTPAGVVAVGWGTLPDGTTEPRAWSSPDGQVWTAVASESFGGDDLRMTRVAVDGDTVVAIGRDVGTEAGDPAVWVSRTAGTTWERLSLNLDELRGTESEWFFDVHLRDGRVVVAGSVDGSPAIWTGTLP